MGKITIETYETEDGRCPVEEFMDSLNPKMLAKVLRSLDLLENNGNELRAPYSTYVRNGVFELRVKLGSDLTRVFYFFFHGNKAILTNGFVKKTQKTPPEVLRLAEKYKADYERRYLHE